MQKHLIRIFALVSLANVVAWVALQDVPEVLPFGQELGVVVSQLSFAYLGGYIFHWLVIVRPSRERTRSLYAATWATLHQVATNAEMMIEELEWFAQIPESRPITRAHIDELCPLLAIDAPIPWCDWSVMDYLKARVARHRVSFSELVPYLLAFDPELTVLLRRIDSLWFLSTIESGLDVPSDSINMVGGQKPTLQGWEGIVWEYVCECQMLQACLLGLRVDRTGLVQGHRISLLYLQRLQTGPRP